MPTKTEIFQPLTGWHPVPDLKAGDRPGSFAGIQETGQPIAYVFHPSDCDTKTIIERFRGRRKNEGESFTVPVDQLEPFAQILKGQELQIEVREEDGNWFVIRLRHE